MLELIPVFHMVLWNGEDRELVELKDISLRNQNGGGVVIKEFHTVLL